MLVFIVKLTSGTYEVDKAVYEEVKHLYDARQVEKLEEKGDVVVVKGRVFVHVDVEPSTTIEELKQLIALMDGIPHLLGRCNQPYKTR
jgi:hypothetical protein